MNINPARKQLAYAVGEFKAAVKDHKAAIENDLTNDSSTEPHPYDAGWLKALSVGLETAEARYKASNMSFFAHAPRNKYRMLLNCITDAREQIALVETTDNAFRAGMIDALDNWAVRLRNDIKNGAGRQSGNQTRSRVVA